jgi:hypothetical protein
VPEALRVVELEHDLKDLELELKTTRVQLEIAQTLPHLLTSSSHEKNNSPTRVESVVKKTTPPQPR